MAACTNWQRILLELHLKLKQNTEFVKFADTKLDYHRIELCFSNKTVRTAVLQCLDECDNESNRSRKSAQLSTDLRAEGNKLFQRNKYKEALNKYTQSILFAPGSENKHSSELSLAFANRSAALYHLEKYQECLNDIQLAFDNEYPKNLCHKLYHRQGHCSAILGQKAQAEEAFNLALSCLESADVSHQRQDLLKNEIIDMLAALSLSNNHSCMTPQLKSFSPSVSYGQHLKIAYASCSLNLVYNTQKGRHILANRKLLIGDTLMLEKPYASVLLPEHNYTYCYHCYNKPDAPLPCHTCSDVLFCSKTCLQQAWQSYHNVECGHLKFLQNIGLTHLALRVILVSGKNVLKDFLANLKKDSLTTKEEIAGCTPDGYYGNNYFTVYHLMPHTEDLGEDNLFCYSVTAVLLLMFLKISKFFSPFTSEINTDACDEFELQVGGLILRNIQQLVCNAHAITTLQTVCDTVGSNVETESQVRIATAIYPTASLMNHSCKPTIISSFINDMLIVKAVKDVLAGEEIFNCYGPHYCKMSLKKRQTTLKQQYFFDCNCEACSGNLDTIYFKAFKCKYCNGAVSLSYWYVANEKIANCSVCGIEQSISLKLQAAVAFQELFDQALQMEQGGHISQAIFMLHDVEDFQERNFYHHHIDLYKTRDSLARCYSSQGKYVKASNILRQCLPFTAIIYGEGSIELANELQKFSDVLLACAYKYMTQSSENEKKKFRRVCEELKVVIERGLKLFLIHYTEIHLSVKELQKKQHIMEQLLSQPPSSNIRPSHC